MNQKKSGKALAIPQIKKYINLDKYNTAQDATTLHPSGVMLSENKRQGRERILLSKNQIDTVRIIRIPIYDDGMYNHEILKFKLYLHLDPEYTAGHPGPLHPIHKSGLELPSKNPYLYRDGYKLAETEIWIWDREVADAKRCYCISDACNSPTAGVFKVESQFKVYIKAIKGNPFHTDSTEILSDAGERDLFVCGYKSMQPRHRGQLGMWKRSRYDISKKIV